MRIGPSFALAFGLVASAVVTAAAAPSRDYIIDVWGTDRGLPTSFVNAVAQTPDGYLWIGTQNGLLRFDGLRFVAFDPDNTPALAHARVEHLFVDGTGTLWANTYDGSLTSVRRGVFQREWTRRRPARLRSVPGRIERRRAGLRHRSRRGDPAPRRRRTAPGTSTVRPATRCRSSPRTRTGALWVRSVDGGLWRLRDGRFDAVSMTGLRGRQVQCLTRDGAGRVWVGTEAEIAVFDGGRFQTMTPTNGEARLDVSMLRFTRDGGLWAVANGRARKARDRTWIWTDEAGRGLTGPFRVSVNFLEDRRGGVWLTHFGKGVLHVRPDGRARRITGADGLPGTRVRDLLEDREGNVWLAIERAGLVRVRDAWFQTLSTDGPREIAVASVAADRDGAMWIGSMGDGLQRYRDGTLASYPVPDASAGGFVFSVVPDATGRIWLSADREDLFYFDGHRIRPSPVHVHGVKTLLADRDGGLWVGTKTGVARIADGRLHVFGPERRLRTPRRAGAGAGTGRRRVDRLGRRHDLSLPRRPADALPSAGCAGLARGLGAAHRRRRARCGPARSAAACCGCATAASSASPPAAACRATSSARSSRTSRGSCGSARTRASSASARRRSMAPRRARSTSSATADRTACPRSSARATISRPPRPAATAGCGSRRPRASCRSIHAKPAWPGRRPT